MKRKIVSALLSIVLLVALFCLPSQASVNWDNTSGYIISHKYVDGNASCAILIDGHTSEVIIRNVDITLSYKMGASYITVATWNDLSSGQYFEFYGIAENVNRNHIYRLSFTAEVVKDGVVEYLDQYLDVDYRTNTRL